MKIQKTVLLTLITIFLSVTDFAYAASLTIYPPSNSIDVGQTFNATVYVSSAEQAANAVSGELSFPKDLLQVQSVSKAGSILSLWVEDPSYSNNIGTVSFEGVALNPGFKGASGKVVNVTFKAIAGGSAKVSFKSGAILANDGNGTNILTDMRPSYYNLTKEEAVVPKHDVVADVVKSVTKKVNSVIGAPDITSTTHPDSDSWYSLSEATFNWDVPDDVEAVKLSLTKNADSTPTKLYSPAISKKTVSDIEDGKWYFHARMKDDGGWGRVAHFPIKIDTQSPVFDKIVFPQGTELDDPRATVYFNASDNLSGIDHYVVSMDTAKQFTINGDEASKDNPYTLPMQSIGEHIIMVKAYDRAGNYTTSASKFTIAKYPFKIVKHSTQIIAGEPLVVIGKTLPNVQVKALVKRNISNSPLLAFSSAIGYKDDAVLDSEGVAMSDKDGIFEVSINKLDKGQYDLIMSLVDEHGVELKTLELDDIVLVTKGSMLSGLTENVSLPVLLAIVVFALVGITLIIAWRLVILRRKIDVMSMKNVVHDTFDELRKDTQSAIMKIKDCDKRSVHKVAESSLAKIDKDIKTAEKNIKAKLRDILDENHL